MSPSWAPAVLPNNYTLPFIFINRTAKEFHFQKAVDIDEFVALDGVFKDIPAASPSWIPGKHQKAGIMEVYVRHTRPFHRPPKMQVWDNYIWEFDDLSVGVDWGTTTPWPQRVSFKLSEAAAKNYVIETQVFDRDVDPQGQERLYVIQLSSTEYIDQAPSVAQV